MKKLLLLSAACLLTASAHALEVSPYVEGKISQNWIKVNYNEYGYGKEKVQDTVLGGGLEIGAKLNQFRVGFEGYYNDTMKDKLGDILPVEGKTKGVFLNAYYDIPLPDLKQIKPYIGGGIGYSWLKATADASEWGLGKSSVKDKDWGWNIGLGVGYAITNNVDLTLGYRYENLGTIKDFEDESKTDFRNHKVSVGVRYTF